MRTDASSRNIWCPIRFMLQQAKMWEEMRRVRVPISKHSETTILWTNQSPSKKNNTTSNSTLHGQEVHNLAKVPCWQRTCPSPSAHLLGTFGHGNTSISPLRAQNYTTVRLPTLRVNLVEYDEEHRSWSTWHEQRWFAMFEIYSFLSKHPLRKNAPFLIFAFLSALFHKISSKVSRDMLKIQTESYFHLTMSKWPIPTVKL